MVKPVIQFNTLKRIREEDNSVIEEEEQFTELASSEVLLQQLRAFLDGGGREAIEQIPDGIHSGLQRAGARGVFFYFKSSNNGKAQLGALVSVVSVLITPARRVSVQADFFRPPPFPYSTVVLSIFTTGSTEGFNPLHSTVPNFVPTGRLYPLVAQYSDN